MPLARGHSQAVIARNISEMRAAGHPQDQSVAAALRMAREHFALGGAPAAPPWFVRNEAHNLGNAGHQGFINSVVPGRTDRHNMSIAGGSYVWPADVVSSIGQGNSLAGANRLSQMFKMGPYGEGASPVAKMMGHPPGIKPVHFADGGDAGIGVGIGANPGASMGAPTAPGSADVVTAGGEFITPPDRIATFLGNGDLDHGHDVADAIVKHVRSMTVKKLKSLPGPKKK